MKRNLLITLVVITFLSLAFFGFKTFVTSIYNQRDCEFANIDNIEVNVGIDIPSIESTACNYNEIKNQKSVYFKFDKEVNIQDYYTSNHFKNLEYSDLVKFKNLDFVGNKITFNDENITIITAPNGYGKTVCLKVIDAIFNKRFTYLSNLDFSSIFIKEPKGSE